RPQRRQFVRPVDDEALHDFLKSWGVRHEIPHGYWTTEGVRHLKIKVVVDVRIQVYFSLFHELHCRCPGKRLRNGSRAEQGCSRRDRSLVLDICIPIALAKENVAIL